MDDLGAKPGKGDLDSSTTPMYDADMDPKVAALSVPAVNEGMDPKVGFVDPPKQGMYMRK